MSSLFRYVPHPHLAVRQRQGPPTTRQARLKLHGNGAMARFNAKAGLKITLIVGTMWAAYLFAMLTFVSAPAAFRSHDPITIVAWLAQTFLQLVLLPIIIVGQNVQATGADERAKATYDDATAILAEAREIQAHLLAQDQALTEILARLNAQVPPGTGAAPAAAPEPPMGSVPPAG